MALYPISTSARMEPLDPPEPTQDELFEECEHRGACERLYQMFVDNREHIGWKEDMARILKCDDCEEFE